MKRGQEKQRQTKPNRGFQVADQIQRDLSELIAREIEGPAGGHGDDQRGRGHAGLRACQGVLQRAGGRPGGNEEALNQAAGFLRNGLFKRLHIHTVPTLHFQFDRTTERAADMNALIAKAVSSRSKEE
jgi:ribosome-binding factor A